MAYTKEQRLAKEAEKEEKLKAELRESMFKEYEAEMTKLKEKLNALTSVETKTEENKNKTDIAKGIQMQRKNIPLSTVIPVTCNIEGNLLYISKKHAGDIVQWSGIGSTEYMELGELVSMKNTDRRFFTDNWIICEDTEEYSAYEIYEFLKVSDFYKNVLTPDTIDEVFDYSKERIEKELPKLSNGMKYTIAVRAKKKLDEGTLDKNIIDVLEAALNVQLEIR